MAPIARFEEYTLSPIDRTYVSNYVRRQLFFATDNTALAVDNLRMGTKNIIEELPFLSGIVVLSEADSSKKEVLTVRPREDFDLKDIFKVKRYDTSVHDALRDTPQTQEERQMPWPQMADPVQPVPILGIQANVFTDGILLTLAVAHMACDAGGVGIMIETLAACCRAQGSKPDRRLTGAKQEAEGRLLLSRDSEALPRDNASFMKAYVELESYGARREIVAPARSHPPKEQLSNYHFTVSADKIDALKKLCNQLLAQSTATRNDDDSCGIPASTRDTSTNTCIPWVSSNDVFVALLWMCYNRSRFPHLRKAVAHTDSYRSITTMLTMAVNIRRRLSPPLPETYMGNAAISLLRPLALRVFEPDTGDSSTLEKEDDGKEEGTITLPAFLSTAFPENSYQMAKTLCRVAHSIRTSLSGITAKYLNDLLSYLTNCSEYVTLVGAGADFSVSSWRALKAFDADFGPGLGQPVHMRRFDSTAEGMVYILPKRGGGAKTPWEFQITLREGTLAELLTDPLWAACMDKDDFWG